MRRGKDLRNGEGVGGDPTVHCFAGAVETGKDSAGLKHILIKHVKDFSNKGITEGEIADFIMYTLQHGEITGMQHTRPVYEVMYNGVH